jgi:pimeloyl-ACP methyl ester carboxylesterase
MIRESDFAGKHTAIHIGSTSGDGPVLLMLHGVTRRWQTFLPVMHAMHLRWQVAAIDLRGHGYSGRVPEQYRVTNYVDDVVDLVERSPFGKVVLYGHSLGAMVAAGAAARLGDRVHAVVMEDPPFRTMGPAIHSNILHSFFAGLSRFAGHRRPLNEVARELGEIILLDPATGKKMLLRETRDAVALRFTAASLQHVDPQVFNPILAGNWMDGYDTTAVFQALKCPALLLQADVAAGGMLTDDDARLIADNASDLVHIRLPGTGHVIHIAQTTQLINLLTGFLESLSH